MSSSNLYDLNLRTASFLGSLSEKEFVDGLIAEIMRTVINFNEDGVPVCVGPFPIDMLRQIAAGCAECTRAYDEARRHTIRHNNGAMHQGD